MCKEGSAMQEQNKSFRFECLLLTLKTVLLVLKKAGQKLCLEVIVNEVFQYGRDIVLVINTIVANCLKLLYTQITPLE